MASKTYSIISSAVSLKSSWTGVGVHEPGESEIYWTYSASSTAKTTRTVDISTIPEGAIINSATLTQQNSVSGVGSSKVSCNGISYTLGSSGSKDVTAWINAMDEGETSLDITFSFKAEVIDTRRTSNSRTLTINSAVLTVTYTDPYSKCGAPTTVALDVLQQKPQEQVTLSWSGATGGTNNDIDSFKIYQNDVLFATINDPTAASYSFNTDNTEGIYTYYIVTVGEVPGYDSDQSASVQLIVQMPDSAAQITSGGIKIIRCDQDETYNDEGEYLRIIGSIDTSASQNPHLYIGYCVIGAASYIEVYDEDIGSLPSPVDIYDLILNEGYHTFGGDIEQTTGYSVKIVIDDDTGRSTYIIEVPAAIYSINFCADLQQTTPRIGCAIGKRATQIGVFDSVFQYYYNGKPLVYDIAVTFDSTDWVQTVGESVYHNTILVSGIYSSDNPVAGILISDDDTLDDIKAEKKAFAKIYDIKTGDGEVTAYAENALTDSVSVRLKGVRL